MLIRIVKMKFKAGQCTAFEALFDSVRSEIASQKGCEGVAIYRDSMDQTVYYTHSRWESEKYLNRYRDSAFFKSTWSKTKILFDGKPEVFSLVSLKAT
ncbi:MAG: antibiotic biosynthesis monooxygenase [Cyclobacteriaceae bacterium]|nr:antibiotic biosynthesis monooxygenase [Cyclobacteriaceae bacterium]